MKNNEILGDIDLGVGSGFPPSGHAILLKNMLN